MNTQTKVGVGVFDSRGRARVGFLPILKVGFGFYPVGFRVLVGFLIYGRKGQILEKIIIIF